MAYIPYGFVQKQNGIFVEPEQAEVVRTIFQRYLNGDSLGGIADFFEQGILSPTGQERWTRPSISKLLSNSKYIGYIISFEDYFAVQVDKGNRSNIDENTNQRKVTRYSSQNVLSGLLICAECGANYRRITHPSGMERRSVKTHRLSVKMPSRIIFAQRLIWQSGMRSLSKVLLRESSFSTMEV